MYTVDITDTQQYTTTHTRSKATVQVQSQNNTTFASGYTLSWSCCLREKVNYHSVENDNIHLRLPSVSKCTLLLLNHDAKCTTQQDISFSITC